MQVKNVAQFKAARKTLGLTKTDIARLARRPNPEGTGYRTVSRWEASETNIPGEMLTLMEALLSGWRPKWWKEKGE